MDTSQPDAGSVATTLDIVGIMAAIPHRYPFLLIDRVVDIVVGQSAVGIKNVTVNENFFQGHFPGHPVMPGVPTTRVEEGAGSFVVARRAHPERNRDSCRPRVSLGASRRA